MPNCYNLTRKSDPEGDAVSLHQVDAEMCAHFNTPVHDKRWYNNWHNSIGWMLAVEGKSFDEIISEYDDNTAMKEIAKWMNENFTSNAWYEVSSGRR